MNFQLIIFSPPENQANEIEQLIQMFDLGLELFHLRKPRFSEKQIAAYLVQIPEKYHPKIVTHSCYDIANKFNLKGIHLPELYRTDRKKLSKEYKIISTGFHNFEDWQNQQKNYQYVFLSPIFDSISKKGYMSNFTSNQLKEKLPNKTTKTFALGGITLDNLQQIKELGFDGAAMIGSVWQAENPVEAFKKMS